MERDRLDLLVADPALVGREDVRALHELTERYPWFAGAQLLRAVGEHRMGDVLSEGALRDATAQIPSRTVLFDLVHGSEPLAPAVPRSFLPEPVPEGSVEEVSAPIQENLEAAGPIDPPAAEAPALDPIDPLEAQIMGSALASAYDLTWQRSVPALPEVKSEEPVGEEPPPINVHQEATAVTPPRSVDRNARLRFTDWLAESGTEEISSTTEGPAVKTAAVAPETSPERVVTTLVTSSPEPATTKDLIDRFIGQQSTTVVPKAEFFTPQQAAKRSLDDTAGLVTETLARVYVQQGNLPKAIDAYHRLALKYPGKSAYFAALAKELEGQLNK